MTDLKKIGIRIRTKREDQGVSQECLAALAGVSRCNLQFIESGQANPTIKTIERIAQALKSNVSEIVKK